MGSWHLVVAYDDVGGWVAARLWWMLEDLGHEAVQVLDGGLPAWTPYADLRWRASFKLEVFP